MNIHNSNVVFDSYGYGSMVVRGVDLEGRPITRSKQDYPYSYDGYVVYRAGPNTDITGSGYSDRLRSWYPNADEVWKKHSNGQGHYDSLQFANPRTIEAFLRELLDDPTLTLVLMMDYCNVSNGYPCGYMGWKSSKPVS